MYRISTQSLNTLFEEISRVCTLYIPSENKKGDSVYTRYETGVEYSNKLNTVRSPKDFFFPQMENLMEFKTEGKTVQLIDIREETEDFVVFGVRPCDVKSFEVLDNVFLNEPVDTYYKNRREHGVIISLACNRPAETCFCGTFGIDAAKPEGDVSAWMTEGYLHLKPNTEKGEKLVSAISGILEECDDTAVTALQENINNIMKKLPLANVTTEKFGGGKTEEFFNAPEWAALSESCWGCGTCTFVCPTCQCYDIKDFNTGKGVIRYRCWDSCMYSEFTKMAHGNNRLSQKERFRQRFMHKLVYYPENNNGLFSCVGCGRCLAKCPISMNIVKVMKTLGGKDNG